MFASTATSDHYSNSTKWKYNNNELASNCPRCASSNTKFCYYNNYSLSQPRYFCKGCRRYWTKGGSLRNVPVGGGCRKSRRARATVRQSGGGATAYAHSESADGSSGGACIDMAAVFAKYVNQNAEVEESLSPGSSENVNGSRTVGVDSRLADQNPMNFVNVGGDDQMQQVMPHFSTCQDITSRQFVYQDFNGFEQSVLCDELSPDMLWSEGTTPLPNYGFQQPMVQVEDCALFAPDDDQLRISANLITDNWGSFDLSAYDFYSTP